MAKRNSPEKRAVFEIWGIVAEAVGEGGCSSQIHQDKSYYIRIGKGQREQFLFVYDSSNIDAFANPASRHRVCYMAVGRFLREMGPLAREIATRYFVCGGYWHIEDDGRAVRQYNERALRWYEHPMLDDLVLRFHARAAQQQRARPVDQAKINIEENTPD